MSKRPVQKHLFRVLTLSLAILLAGSGIAVLYQWHLGSISSYASSDYVVGQPSLPAANVDAIFRRMGSPMVGTGQAVEAASRAQNIDDAFALAVWWTETNDGAAGVGLADRNPGSVRGSTGYPSAYDGYTIYPSYSAAVSYWFMMLKKVYINRGLTTVSSISHPYVGTSTSDLWAGKVITLMQRYRAEAPPPATPVPTIAPDIARQGKQLAQEQQQQGQSKSTYYPPVAQSAQNTPTTSVAQAHGLSGNTRTMLVLFDLLLALAIGLWAWSVNRRYAGTAQPAPATSTASNPWQPQAMHEQPQPAFAAQTASNPWQPQAMHGQPQPAFAAQTASNPWQPLGINGQQQFSPAMRPISNPWELASAHGQQQFSPAMPMPGNPWELATSANGQQSSAFNAFSGPLRTTDELTPDMRTTETLAVAPPSRPNYAASASLFSLEAFLAEQNHAQDFQPVQALVEQQDWPSNISTTSYEPGAPAYEPSAPAPNPALLGLSRSAQGPLHRTRLQAASDTPGSSQPQPVGAGAGGGLLSRYREMQAQSEQ
jgi:hypothetical protein